MCSFLCITLWPMSGAGNPVPKTAVRFEARIVDGTTGKPLAARVAITNAQGRFVEIDGEHAHVRFLDKRWCYVKGSFSLELPASGIGIEIRRGFEVRPLMASLGVGGDRQSMQQTFRLQRWIDTRRMGYFSGDIHAHLPVPREAYPQMEAEGLNTLTLLSLANSPDTSSVNRCFTGTVDSHSTTGCEIYVSQEIQDWQMGHITLLNLRHLVTGYPDTGGSLEYWRSNPDWDLLRAMRATHRQNGLVFWSHLCSLPGAQSPIGIALGLVEGIELITWNDPTQLPNHWSPWKNSGMSQAEFPVMRAVDLYYQYLNAGFRLPIAAGTDKFGEEIPLGSNRTYARTKEPATYSSWLEGVKAGNGFVSNGPILEFETGELGPGDVVSFKGTKKVKAHARARSIVPFTTLEIILNGETIGHKTIPIQNNPPVAGVYSMELEITLEIEKSAWLAARVAEHPDLRNPILPRGLSVFAHSNPIYFLQNGHKVREAASIAYLRKYVQGTLHWLGTNPPFFNEEDRQSAKRDAQLALKVYKGL
jgi:hypothetical protein